MADRLRYPSGCIHRHGEYPCDCVPNHEPWLWCDTCEDVVQHVYVNGTEFDYECRVCCGRRRFG